MNEKHFHELFRYQIVEHEENEGDENHWATKYPQKIIEYPPRNSFLLFLYAFQSPIFSVVQDNFLQMDLIVPHTDVCTHHQYCQLLEETNDSMRRRLHSVNKPRFS